MTVGFSLQRALNFTAVVMQRQRPVLAEINTRLQAGETLADSLQPFVKPDLYYQLLLAEEHGELVATLTAIGQLLVTKQQQRQKLSRLLQYPLLLLFLLGILTVGLSVYVFPELNSWQGEHSQLLSMRARLLIRNLLVLISGLLLLGFGAVIIHWRHSSVNRRIDWLCQLPVIGKSYRLYYGYYITSSLAILLHCGMSLKEILIVVDQFSPNSLLFCLGKEAQQQVQSGDDLTRLIHKHHFLPQELTILISKGQTVEELGADLSMLAKMQFNRLLTQLGELLTLLQPAIFILIAIVIVALYLSILLPIYHSIQGVY